MSRRHSAEKREIIPDPKFGDVVVTKFMNSIMYDGKKSAAERIVYGAFDLLESRTKSAPLEVFKQEMYSGQNLVIKINGGPHQPNYTYAGDWFALGRMWENFDRQQ